MKLIAVTDDKHSVDVLAATIIEIQEYVDFIHIREKSKPASELAKLLRILETGKVDCGKIVLNDRLDVALLFGIKNVQLPGHGLPVSLVKQKYPELIVGVSIHTLAEAKQAERDGADYVLYGHCFETNCKPGIVANGLGLLSEITSGVGIPVYAIGGMTGDRVSLIEDMGAAGVAVMSGIFSTSDPVEMARNFYEICRGNNNGK